MTVRRICAHHGAYSGAECPACARDRATRSKPATDATRIRSSSRWKRTRARILDRDGNRCTYGTRKGEMFWWPDGRCPVVDGLDVHHVKPIEQGGAAFDERNLRSLCATHHRRLEERRPA